MEVLEIKKKEITKNCQRNKRQVRERYKKARNIILFKLAQKTKSNKYSTT
jgi:hypothetical protein